MGDEWDEQEINIKFWWRNLKRFWEDNLNYIFGKEVVKMGTGLRWLKIISNCELRYLWCWIFGVT